MSGGGVEALLTTQETPPSSSSSSSSSPSVAAQTMEPLDSLVTDHRSGLPTGSQVSVSVPLADQPAAPSSIEFRHVSFHYSPRTYHSSGSSPAIDAMDSSFEEGGSGLGSPSTSTSLSGQSISLLKNVSFSILPGENVAIVGPSGSGELLYSLSVYHHPVCPPGHLYNSIHSFMHACMHYQGSPPS